MAIVTSSCAMIRMFIRLLTISDRVPANVCLFAAGTVCAKAALMADALSGLGAKIVVHLNQYLSPVMPLLARDGRRSL
jgi:hypothetical protein